MENKYSITLTTWKRQLKGKRRCVVVPLCVSPPMFPVIIMTLTVLSNIYLSYTMHGIFYDYVKQHVLQRSNCFSNIPCTETVKMDKHTQIIYRAFYK